PTPIPCWTSWSAAEPSGRHRFTQLREQAHQPLDVAGGRVGEQHLVELQVLDAREVIRDLARGSAEERPVVAQRIAGDRYVGAHDDQLARRVAPVFPYRLAVGAHETAETVRGEGDR